jgi:hypothetical protein
MNPQIEASARDVWEDQFVALDGPFIALTPTIVFHSSANIIAIIVPDLPLHQTLIGAPLMMPTNLWTIEFERRSS